jgi:hypothetical protein
MSYDTAIQQWIIATTGYDDQHVFRSQQVGSRPNVDHATYLNIAGQDSDYSEVKKIETVPESDNYDVSYTSSKSLVYSVNIFAADGDALLSKLWKSRYLLIPRLALRDEGLVLQVKSDNNEVPTPGDTSWRRQFHADFTFALYTVDNEEIEKLYTYRLEGDWTKIIGDDLEVVITDS